MLFLWKNIKCESTHILLQSPGPEPPGKRKKKPYCTENTLTLNTINHIDELGKWAYVVWTLQSVRISKPTSSTEHTHPPRLCTQSWTVYLFKSSLNHIIEFTDVTKVGLKQEQQEVTIQREGGVWSGLQTGVETTICLLMWTKQRENCCFKEVPWWSASSH